MPGYLIIYRDEILNMPWYTNAIASRMFLHLLLTANHTDGYFEGVHIKRGQRVTGYESLSRELNISYQQARTALGKLKSTGTVTVSKYSKFSVISLENYETIQGDNSQINSLLSGNQQAYNSQVTANNKEQVITSNAIKDIEGEKVKRELTEIEKTDEWKAYKQMRVKIKKPLTERAAKMVLNNLEKLSPSIEIQKKILDQSILNCWAGVFPLKSKDSKKSFSNPENYIDAEW